MRIGFDAKRAFNNFTCLGNYSRDTIRILSSFYAENDYLLYTPKTTFNQRLKFLENQSKIKIRSPKKILDKLLYLGKGLENTHLSELHTDRYQDKRVIKNSLLNFDYSKQRIDDEVIDYLLKIPDLINLKLPNKIQAVCCMQNSPLG